MERKLIAAAVSSALVLPIAAQAVEFSVSGHVNRAVTIIDGGGVAALEMADPYDGDVGHTDANSSETRFRFTGSGELDNGLTTGIQLEIGRPSAWRTRHANVYLQTAGGKLTLGQASTATDGVAHADLGGPSWLGGATNWCSYVSAGPACPSNDGGRMEILRYDTPNIGPASISTSIGNDDYWDVMLKVAGSMGEAGYDVRIGHTGERGVTAVDGTKGDAGDITTASAAVAFGQGTSIAAGWSQDKTVGFNNDDTDVEHDYLYFKIDHSYGDGSIGVYTKSGSLDGSVDASDYFSDLSDLRFASDGSLWGIAIGHNLGAGATGYAGYRNISADVRAKAGDVSAKVNMNDIDMFVVGLRVAFN